MNADDFIKALEARNPMVFAADKLKITPDELRRVIRDAFNAGVMERVAPRADYPPGFEKLFRA
jgi:DNA-binding Lrp family transcriptional regulator